MDSIAKSLNPNKHLKEEFVSNLTGSSMIEIVALSTIVPVLMLLPHSLGLPTSAGAKKSWAAYLVMIVSYLCIVIVPILLFLTILAGWTYEFAILLLVPLLFSCKREERPNSLRQSISSYRVAMMVVTCLCILAVDFNIFPRRYAKTETYGSSLMDLGVGSFVLANALVSREARNLATPNWKTAITSTSPLIILGIGRLISTTVVNYQVHVGEYGVHWNFFFTLAAVAILTSVIRIPSKYCGVLGSLILFGYQVWLSLGLRSYLLSDKRGPGIISQNKEGIFSVVGYWGMYLVGVQLGSYLFFGCQTTPSRSSRWTRNRLYILSIFFWILTVVLDKHVERVSRRTCNLPYVTAVIAQNLQVLALLMLSDFIPGYKSSALVEAINQNLLATFLLANLLTGLVNMLMDTLNASSVVSLVVLIGYAFVLCITIGLTHFRGIRLKFW
uniref:Phosphatidylinositol-glycan biosynthesis class W protein n=1 Tax=Kalanchoe fedtschenkoi TaxID=63787 RepID=A0A7N0TAJ2_KALFE